MVILVRAPVPTNPSSLQSQVGATNEGRLRPVDLGRVAQACALEPGAHPRVQIDWDAVGSLSDALGARAATHGRNAYGWDDPAFWPIEAEHAVRSQLLAVGNVLNFRFWTRSTAGIVQPIGGHIEGEWFTGSMYLWRRLRIAHASGVPVGDAEFLAQMDTASLNDLFSDDDGVNPLEVGGGDRIANLRDLGTKLLRDWDGQFLNVVAEAHESVPHFVQLSKRFRAFDDPLAKLTFVNALMHQGSGLVQFDGPLLPAIDYQLLKQLLRQRVLIPDEQLGAKIRSNDYLNAHESLELRFAAMEALLIAGTTSGLPGDVVDNLIWQNREICSDANPQCGLCPFRSFCAQDTDIPRPLHLTRWF